MMFVSLIATMIGATPLPAQEQIKMTSDERWTLVQSLKRQLGGGFILAGVAKADGTCRDTGTCISSEGLRSDPATSDARSVSELLANARVDGKAPTAIVAVRGVRQRDYHSIQVLASVYDAQTGRWSDMTGNFGVASSGEAGTGGQRYVRWHAGFVR